MKRALVSILAVALCSLMAGSFAEAQSAKKKCRLRCGRPITKSYDLSASSVSGDQIRGPATVRADNLNILRYDYKFNIAVSFSAAPDLWAKLQSVANPAATTPPEKPTAGGSRPAVMQAFKVSKSVQALLDQAEAAITDATAAMDAAQNLIDGAVGSGDPGGDCLAHSPAGLDITKETNREGNCLSDQTAKSATAVSRVKAGGQAVIALLQKKWTQPDLLVGYIGDALDTNSSFTAGTTAVWPDFEKTATLKQSAAAWKTELAARSSKFNDGVVAASGSLVASKKPLTDLEQTLNTKAKTASGDDQKALQSEAQRVHTTADNLDDKTKQLTKTTSLLGWATTENQRVVAAIPDLEASSTKYTDFETAQEALISWKTRMSDLRDRWKAYKTAKDNGKTEEENPSPFSLTVSADCEFAFSRTKTTAITLTRADLMPGTTSAAPETVLAVSVECTSPFTVSAGVDFSTIEKHEFAIQASPATPPATGTVNKFVLTNNSNFHPLPLGMIHARLCEFDERFALHASLGLAGNIQSQSAGGSSAEFLIGPSFSLFRTMFLTPGLHIGTKTVIGGGFNVGDTVPSNITTVPLQKSYTTGFGFAITFTKP